MGELLPQKAALSIIDAQRRNYKNKTIPSYYLSCFNIMRYVNYAKKNLITIQCIIFKYAIISCRINSFLI